MLWSVVGLVPVLIVLWLGSRWVDRRPFSALGLRLSRRWWRDLVFGMALGALLMAGIFAVQLAAGWITLRPGAPSGAPAWARVLALMGGLSLFVAVGVGEECVTRGYLLGNLAQGLNLGRVGPRRAILLAWLLSSLAFGWLHARNPNATPLSSAFLAVAGLMLGLGYVLTGGLAISIGLHITWNLSQGTILGFPVSGITFPGATLIAIEQGGPAVWTGGRFGPEAGLLGLAACALGSMAILVWVSRTYGRIALSDPIAVGPAVRAGRCIENARDASEAEEARA